MKEVGLVLEGGGMRGVFTGGILEYCLEQNLHFSYVVAVSAGACNAASYVSKQKGRNKHVTVDYAGHPEYISFKRLFTNGELFNMDLIFDTIPNIESPFDYKSFFQSDQLFYTGVTDCYTGETIYYEKNELNDDFNKILRASCSLPMLAPIVKHENRPFLDGGISDPIPVNKSLKDGNKKHVVILTQCDGYIKKPLNRGKWWLKRKYKNYPGLVDIILTRARIYNDSMKLVKELEREGKAFVFRPTDLRGVGRTERRKERLQALYDHGYELASKRKKELEQFLLR
ncbi:patatin-like phospholipase family protein [Evansella cellulosilytica]|uniref:Patatin n=1 Tax=Evansella cellulosilytica (strain ATCC 21833 / DSM 2522 / FERM P-1141 / JCM 9156 / N-4) TaxID=649639 RepID=E6U087_EVAC2|nr:patatin family protein [Evansella cellulosilytica]ADU30203.1 Patatin [Evansella cellulosilytica DSM 2522]